MIGPEAPNGSERQQAQTADYRQQASPAGESAGSASAYDASGSPTWAAYNTPGGWPSEPSAPSMVPRQAAAERTPPERKTPWLPPAWREKLPDLVLPVTLMAIPVVAALALQIWLARTHASYDANLAFEGTSADKMVTALQWSPEDGALYAGTLSGGVLSIGPDGTRFLNETFAEAIHHPVEGFPFWGRLPYYLVQVRYDLAVAGPPRSGLLTPALAGLPDFPGGLFAAVEANNGSAVIGRAAAVGDTVQQFDVPQQIQMPDQQQVMNQKAEPLSKGVSPQRLPTGDPFTPQGEPLAAQSTLPRYSLVLYRDLHSASATEVGEISGIEDARAVAALPGTDAVIAGDGEGNVFAIDASQQISGVSPETYVRGIGQHEAAIVEIAVAAQPSVGGVLFATRAEDRTIKVWRGSLSRAGLFPLLGDYRSTDVTTPGSTWVRESIQFASRRSRTSDPSLAALLAMSEDGRRILARRADRRLVILDLPAQGEDAAVNEYDDVNFVGEGAAAMLSPDGSRLVAANAIDSTVELQVSNVAGDKISRLTVASFPGLAGNQYRSFAFDRTGRRFVAIATSGPILVQNVETPERAIAVGRYQGRGSEAAISPDGSLVAVAETSGRIAIHSTEGGNELASFQGPQNPDRVVFDESGKRIRVSVKDSGQVHTYSLQSLRSLTNDYSFEADVGGGQGFIPNGNRYFSRNGNAGFRITDIDSGSFGTLQAATGSIGWVSSLDGSRIVTLGGRGNISVFGEVESEETNGPMPAMADKALRLSADGRTLVAGGRTGELYLARLGGEAGQMGYRLRRLTLPAPALQYEISPDGASIVMAEADGTVTVGDLTGGASEGNGANGVQQPAPSPGVTIAGAIEISGHGAPLTAMALSPGGQRLATASLDGRLRVTDVAWAKFVRRLPFASLPSGPERTKLEPQPLDESPYAWMGGPTVTTEVFDQNPPFEKPFIVVYNARRSLSQALDAGERAAAVGLRDSLIYRHQRVFRGVFAFATEEARDDALPNIQQVFSGAYARDLRSWCPSPAQRENFIDCEAVMAGAEPPPAMAN